MEERKIIESKHYNAAIIALVIIFIGLFSTLIWNIVGLSHSAESYQERMSTMSKYWSEQKLLAEYGTQGQYMFKHFYSSNYTCHSNGWYSLIPFATFFIIGAIIYLGMKSYSLTVTDKRIYGKTWFGKRVDLPVDSVSATSTISLFRGVSVSTSSGKISFLLIKNANEVYTELNNLVINRQSEKNESNPAEIIKETQPLSNADELKKYKDLLDQGIITQEEFDAKKKQLLGL